MGIVLKHLARQFEIPEESKALCDVMMEAAKSSFRGVRRIRPAVLLFSSDPQYDQNLDCNAMIKDDSKVSDMALSIRSICSEFDAIGVVLICRMWAINMSASKMAWTLADPSAMTQASQEHLVTIAQSKGHHAAMRAASIGRTSARKISSLVEPKIEGDVVYWPMSGPLASILN